MPIECPSCKGSEIYEIDQVVSEESGSVNGTFELALFEVGDQGAVLVRPDAHVAWRTLKPAAEGASDLRLFLEQQWLPYWRQARPQHV